MTKTNTAFKHFALGQVVATRRFLDALSPERLPECLSRHARGDWRNVCADDGARKGFPQNSETIVRLQNNTS
jgi:hypothetical protein